MGNTLMNTSGLLGLGMKIVIQAGWASILTLAMHFIGVDFDVLPVAVVWASVALVYMLPIGPGFIEIAYLLIYGLILYWQKRDRFSLLSADSAQYADKWDSRPDEVTQ